MLLAIPESSSDSVKEEESLLSNEDFFALEDAEEVDDDDPDSDIFPSEGPLDTPEPVDSDDEGAVSSLAFFQLGVFQDG